MAEFTPFTGTEEGGFLDWGKPRRPGSPGRILCLNGVRNFAGRFRDERFERRGVEKLDGVISASVVFCMSRAAVTGVPESGCRFSEVHEVVRTVLRGGPERFWVVDIFVARNGDLKVECRGRDGIFIFGSPIAVGIESGVSGRFRALESVVRTGLLSFR
jgi:hypothetical protein